jgi:hypothetical protein
MSQKAPVLSHKQVYALIKGVGKDRTVVVQGENGVGKTAIQSEFMRDPDFANYHVRRPLECTQMSDGSIWMPDIDRELGVSRELPNERFHINAKNRQGVEGSTPVVICLDEVFKATNPVKCMIAPVQYERTVGDYEAPNGSIVWCATNLECEGLGDSVKAHFRSRIIKVVMRKPYQPEWASEFAVPNNLHPAIIATTALHPEWFDSFLDYEQGGKHEGRDINKDNPVIYNPRTAQDGYVSPRTLHAASDVLYAAPQLDRETVLAALCGTVGTTAGFVISSMLHLVNDIPSPETVFNNPDNAPLSNNANAQALQVFQLLNRATTRDAAAAVVRYVRRMRTEMQTIFRHSLKDSQRERSLYGTVTEYLEMLRDNRLFV